jgi:uncharacterized RDD family membrane protein YckC
LVADGSLYPDDLVWREGMADWVETREALELYDESAQTAYHQPQSSSYQPEVAQQAPSQWQAAPQAPAQLRPVTYAGFWTRLWAFIIDAIILSAAGGVVGLSIDADFDFDFWRTESAIQIVVFWLYFALMESSHLQATVGKMALGLKVTDDAGRPLSFGQATGRHFAKYISFMIAMIGFIMIALTEKQQGLHDMIAGCLVVKQE